MSREPRPSAMPVEIRTDDKPSRFQIRKLEERIAPKCPNPQGAAFGKGQGLGKHCPDFGLL